MSKNICEVIRRELDELTLGETLSTTAVEHLRECAACREFNQKQTRLRQIVGSLGTVSAPPDFDFRLRARLANDANGASFHFWPVARRGLAFVAVLLVFVVGAIVVRNLFNRPAEHQLATDQHNTAPAPAPHPVATVPSQQGSYPAPPLMASSGDKHQPPVRSERPARSKRPPVAEDFSNDRAPLYGREPARTFEVLPLDSSLQSYKFSFDDGRGNERTISVPTISFGSQRMLQTGNQYASKRDW